MTKETLQNAFRIWGDNRIEIEWFRNLHQDLSETEGSLISSRAANPDAINRLISYDRPDIILTKFGQPILVVEKTREVPTGHNVGQRLARLVRSAEERVPTIMFFPFDAMKHGRHAGMCYMNARLLETFRAMQTIHETPVLAVNWPHDLNGELVVDGSENNEMRVLMADFFTHGCPRSWPAATTVSLQMREEYGRRVARRPAYGELPPSVNIIPTSTLSSYTSLSASVFEQQPELARLQESVVYRIGMTPLHCRREDPFTGSQFIYDYTECRTGPRVHNKKRNLILWFPALTKRRFMDANPNDAARKSSNWYLTANALVFSDGVFDLQRGK